MNRGISIIECDACGEDERNLGFTVGQSLLPHSAFHKVDVCVACKADGIFACPNCRKLHSIGGDDAYSRRPITKRGKDCPTDAELIDKTP